eukprot:311973_1
MGQLQNSNCFTNLQWKLYYLLTAFLLASSDYFTGPTYTRCIDAEAYCHLHVHQIHCYRSISISSVCGVDSLVLITSQNNKLHTIEQGVQGSHTMNRHFYTVLLCLLAIKLWRKSNIISFKHLKYMLALMMIPNCNAYFVGTTSLSWGAAQSWCVAAGSELASIHSYNDWLEAKVKCENTNPAHGCWIGLSDSDSNGTWVYIDGTASDYGFNGNNPTSPTLTFPWADGQPLGWTTAHDCVVMSNGEYSWYDVPCADSGQYGRHAICNGNSKNPTPSPTINPTPSPTINPTPAPTKNPSPSPTINPTPAPTKNPTLSPTPSPTINPTPSPT